MKTRTGSRQTVLTRAVSEAMERRVLLAFNNALVNDPTRDPVGINGSFNTQSETASLAFTPLNTTEHYVVSAYNDTGEGLNGQHGMGWALSIDGGRTFTDKPTLPYSTDRSQGLRGESGDAVLARDTFSGTIYLAANSRPLGAVPGTQVFRSTDNGATFAAPVTALTGISGATFIDKPWIAVDNADPTRPGNVYLMAMVGLSTGNRNLVFCRSIDFGSTWSMPITILSAPSGATTSGVGANVVVGADHKVYAFYRQQSTIFGSSYEVRRSTDFGLSFLAPRDEFQPPVVVAQWACSASFLTRTASFKPLPIQPTKIKCLSSTPETMTRIQIAATSFSSLQIMADQHGLPRCE